jgi:hypothetical protein
MAPARLYLKYAQHDLMYTGMSDRLSEYVLDKCTSPLVYCGACSRLRRKQKQKQKQRRVHLVVQGPKLKLSIRFGACCRRALRAA